MSNLRKVSDRHDARLLTLRNLGVRHPDQTLASTSVVCAEAIRSALWSLSAHGSESVYITRLLNGAARLALPWLESSQVQADDRSTTGDLLRTTLEELEFIGDVAALPHGRWLPTPLRFVWLPAIDRWLLLGGVPTHQLGVPVQAALEFASDARLLTRYPADLGFPPRSESEESWRRLPVEPLDVWTRQVLEETELIPDSQTDRRIEYYAPAIGVEQAVQFYRWTTAPGKLRDGRYLIRSTAHRGLTHYAVAEIRHQRIIATGSPNLGTGDIRRLMYGLDLLHHRPVKITIRKAQSSWQFELQNELPRSEHRLLIALGHLKLSPETYYPRWWEVPARYAPVVEQALRNLGVRLVEPAKSR
jgi:hypothetical protein